MTPTTVSCTPTLSWFSVVLLDFLFTRGIKKENKKRKKNNIYDPISHSHPSGVLYPYRPSPWMCPLVIPKTVDHGFFCQCCCSTLLIGIWREAVPRTSISV